MHASDSSLNIGSLAQVGAYERGSSDDDSVYVEIMEEVTHPAYNPDTHEFDFRLLRVGGWVRNMWYFYLCNVCHVSEANSIRFVLFSYLVL